MRNYLLFWLDDRRFAIDVAAVSRVVPMVEITPWPQAPAGLAGVITVHGGVVPVFDLRRRFELPHRSPRPADQLLLVTAGGRPLAVAVDSAEGVLPLPEGKLCSPQGALAEVGAVAVAEIGGETIFVCDLERMAGEILTNKALATERTEKTGGDQEPA